jgi:hypothetical protein
MVLAVLAVVGGLFLGLSLLWALGAGEESHEQASRVAYALGVGRKLS